ncbi:MAG: phosphate signaling complex protein PhoU [Clostridiaceae bacterium]|jgi:phosphate transport system protein|nr:phosphate signaling complex protein PhoU [Clostridiaceae bacterium]
MRSRFIRQLSRLNKELIEMGALCELAIKTVSEALANRDYALAETLTAIDEEIDQKERDIESLSLKLLLRQQPVAGDLRQISAALKMITDLERIGDQAEDIAEIIVHLADKDDDLEAELSGMANATMKMVTDSVDAYVKRDTELARAVMAADDVVDNYFSSIKKDLINAIAADPDAGEYALDLLMIAKYYERIGDHAVNVAEWVVFSITGIHRSTEYEERMSE